MSSLSTTKSCPAAALCCIDQEPVFLENACTATRMLEKRRHLFEAQEALEMQKEEFARREDTFHRREEQLRKRDLKLQESLIMFNSFLQENENKKTRAIKKYNDEFKQIEIKEKEIIRLQKILREKKREEKQLKIKLNKNMKYNNYLNSVVGYVQKKGGVSSSASSSSTSPSDHDFQEIQDILNRHNTLLTVNKYLIKSQTKTLVKNDKIQGDYVKFIKEESNSMLNHNNEIASLQKTLEEKTLESSHIETEVENEMKASSNKMSELGQVINSIDNIFEQFENAALLRKNNGKPPGAVAVRQQQQKIQHQSLNNSNDAIMSTSTKSYSNNNNSNTSTAAGGEEKTLTQQSKSIAITELREKQVIDRLERIFEYIVDYSDIIRAYRTEMQLQQ